MGTPIDTPSAETHGADAFAKRLLEIINGGSLALMISIGHRTGLFDTMAALPPATSREIAAAAGLNERYVREWLGAMTVGGIVRSDGAGTLFHLPTAHAALLTRDAGADNIGVFAQYVAVLGSVEDGIVTCFQNGGGLPYEAYERFNEVMAEDSGQSVLPALIDGILPLVPGSHEALERGIDVLDVGCGRGRALNLLAQRFPHSRFLGIDFSPDVVAFAAREAASHGLRNVQFETRDAAAFEPVQAFDLVTAFDAIHDQKEPDRVLRNIARALRPGGTFLMQDIAGSSHVHKNMNHPLGPTLYTVSCMHCMSVSLAQGGAGLGTMWGEEKAHEYLRRAGFNRILQKNLPHDIQNTYYIAQPAWDDSPIDETPSSSGRNEP